MKPAVIISQLTAAASLFSAGCDTHRDLYDISLPMVRIEGDWISSLGQPQMYEATVMLYREGGMMKEFFSRPNSATASVTRGQYDVLTFNGVMESESETNLNDIYFRGTEQLRTFEAYAARGVPIHRLPREEGEYIASNGMELLACSHTGLSVEADTRYTLRYRDGRNGYQEAEQQVESVLQMIPRAVSYRFQVLLTDVVNPRSARTASGSLRGFSGSVFVSPARGIPQAGFPAAHHLNLTASTNSRPVKNDRNEETGSLRSAVFVSFGPPLPDDPDRIAESGVYTFELSFLLKDNTIFAPDRQIDITPQVNEVIRRIHRHHSGQDEITIGSNLFTIEIGERIELPVIAPPSAVEVPDWDDADETIIIWIK